MSKENLIFECTLFDMDGTLIDTTPAVTEHWEEYAATYGLDAQEILKMSHGRPMRDTILYWTPKYATPEIVDMYERKLAANSNGVALAPGVADLYAVIPYERFGMYTGAKLRTAEARLKQCQLDRPKALFAGDTVSQGKPEPEGWIKAAEVLGYSGPQCVVFEDSAVGVKSAKAAGMFVIACLTTHSLQQLQAAGADIIVENLTKVKANIAKDGRIELTISSRM